MRRKLLHAALLALSVVNVSLFGPIHSALACECTAASGAKCTGTCCTTKNGDCICKDSACKS